MKFQGKAEELKAHLRPYQITKRIKTKIFMKETNEKWKRVFFDFHLIENIIQYVRNETKTWFGNGLLPLIGISGISIVVSSILYPMLACTAIIILVFRYL